MLKSVKNMNKPRNILPKIFFKNPGGDSFLSAMELMIVRANKHADDVPLSKSNNTNCELSAILKHMISSMGKFSHTASLVLVDAKASSINFLSCSNSLSEA